MTSSLILRAFALAGLLPVGAACREDERNASSGDTPSPSRNESTDSYATTHAGARAPGVGTWVSPPVDDIPAMKIELSPSGEVRWDSGLAVFGPARWSYDSAAHLITISMPALDREHFAGFADNAERGYILSFDSATRTVYTAFTPDSTRFFFAGYWFDRAIPRAEVNAQP